MCNVGKYVKYIFLFKQSKSRAESTSGGCQLNKVSRCGGLRACMLFFQICIY